MNPISIRHLHKLSEKAIGELVSTAHVQFGGRTIALLVPLKRTNIERNRTTPAKTKQAAKGCDPRTRKGPCQT